MKKIGGIHMYLLIMHFSSKVYNKQVTSTHLKRLIWMVNNISNLMKIAWTSRLIAATKIIERTIKNAKN